MIKNHLILLPRKKQRREQIQNENVEMEDLSNDKHMHTYAILLTNKEQEIQSLRQRLKALTTSGFAEQTTQTSNNKPDEKDRSPLSLQGHPPGLETDLGDNL